MTPAERLLAAADLLDKRAGEATEGPWFNTRDGEVKNAKNWDVVDRNGAAPKDARYIATVHPEVGKALAALMRWEADCVAFNDGRCALALADLVLAGAA